MDELEHAWYLDRLQLLFLLSMTDSRPVAGLPLGDPGRVDLAGWRTVALTLVQEGWLQAEEGHLGIIPELQTHLKQLKDADRVWMGTRRDPEDPEGAPLRCIFYPGSRVICLEPDGDTGVRLSVMEDLTADWFRQEAGLEESGLPEDLVEAMERLPDLRERMDAWLEHALEPDAPDGMWIAVPECRLVWDLYEGEEHTNRWVFLSDDLCPMILRQGRDGTTITLDTAQARRNLLEAGPGTEERYAAG